MIENPKAAWNYLSVLTLAFEVDNERPDRPVVSVLVDGTGPFATAAPKALAGQGVSPVS